MEKFVASNGTHIGKLRYGWTGPVDPDDFGLLINGISFGSPQVKALREFFLAEAGIEVEEPKPWKDAQPGEAWLVTISLIGEVAAVVSDADFCNDPTEVLKFVFHDAEGGNESVSVNSSDILSARRIYPEVSDD